MADDASNDDQWLYGDSVADTVKDDTNEQPFSAEHAPGTESTNLSELTLRDGHDAPPGTGTESEEAAPKPDETTEQEDADKNEGEVDEDDDDDSDDDVNVVIGDIKTSTSYSTLNIKRGGLLTSATIDKIGGKQPGKFSIEEFEQIGTINGLPAHEFNLDSLEDKPWRKPGADITDYFNYGFNEETWRAYCERQKRMRVHESGVGLGPLANTLGGTGAGQPGSARPGSIPVAIVNDNSKYAAALGMRKAGPPPGRKVAGSIDVIGSGGGTLASRRNNERDTPPKENIIQVMTADRREYSRKSAFPDMSVPPPAPTIPPTTFEIPPPMPVPSTFPPPVPPPANYGQQEFYSPDTDPYYQSYEPTQEQQQWSSHEPFVPREEGLPGIPSVNSVKVKEEPKSSPKASSSTRDVRERERERERKEHRSHRHRSRSRSPSERERKSRRHKSRSRSPGHRSHRKKKSKKSDKSKDDESD